MDKRIIRTRVSVFNALFDLSTEKSLDKISVIELCEKANINKSTFYLHYKSMDDCIEKCFDYFTNIILDLGKDISYDDFDKDPSLAVKKLFDLIEQNIKYFQAFSNSVVYEKAIAMLKQKLVSTICERNNLNMQDNYKEIAKLSFVVGGCGDMIINFIPNFDRTEMEELLLDILVK